MSIKSKQFKILGDTIRLTLLLSGLFAALGLVGYIIAGGWNDAQRWGALGDYIGGVLNSIFGFANVIILVVISYQLALMEDSRAQTDRALQEHLSQLQPRYAAVQEIGEYQFQINSSISDKDQVKKLEGIQLRLRSTMVHHRILFPDLNFNNKTLFAGFDVLIKTTKRWRGLLSQAEGEIADIDRYKEELKEAGDWMNGAQRVVNSEITRLQKEMMLFVMNPKDPAK